MRLHTFCPLLVDLEPAHIRMPPQLVHGGAARARRGHRPRAVGHLLAEAPLLAQKQVTFVILADMAREGVVAHRRRA